MINHTILLSENNERNRHLTTLLLCDGYTAKPIDPDTFLAEMESYLPQPMAE